jgi:YbgC/YbaW family acyl-CoA thioester hydrolase
VIEPSAFPLGDRKTTAPTELAGIIEGFPMSSILRPDPPHIREGRTIFNSSIVRCKTKVSRMAYEFKAQRRVEFSDTDMAGIMHYSNFFRFMETAEHGFYRSLGFSVVDADLNPRVGWPRVHAECDYRKPLRFEDLVEIHLLVTEKRSKALTFQFRFRKLNGEPVEEVARGALTVVCVAHAADGSMKAVPIPTEIAGKIEAAPAEML